MPPDWPPIPPADEPPPPKGSPEPGWDMILLGRFFLRGALASDASSAFDLPAHWLLGHLALTMLK